MRADVARIQAQLVDARIQSHQCQLVMKMDIGDERHIRHTLSDLFKRDGRIFIGHGETHDLAPGAHHLFDLRNGRGDIRRVRLRHRLHDDGRAPTHLYIFNFYCSCLSHINSSLESRVWSQES